MPAHLVYLLSCFPGVSLPALPSLQLVDAPGTNDASTVRKVLQRQLEEEVDSVVVLTPKVLSSNEAVLNHLAGSPFLENYVMERLAGAAASTTTHHHLSVMMYLWVAVLACPSG